MFDALEFLAELTQHIRPKGTQLIRRYGIYSSRIKARWEQMDHVAERAPRGWREAHEKQGDSDSESLGFSPLSETKEVGATARKSATVGSRLRRRPSHMSAVRVRNESNRGDPGYR